MISSTNSPMWMDRNRTKERKSAMASPVLGPRNAHHRIRKVPALSSFYIYKVVV